MKIAPAVILALLLPIPYATAKRPAPVPVPPVVSAAIEYSAPHTAMGFVVATDTHTHKELWRARIYPVRIDPALERDVQDVFITSLALAHGQLIIVNERGDRYTLDPATRKSTKLPR